MKRKVNTKKMILTAMFACFSFVLNTFVYFPSMAPFQHFVNLLAAIFVGPWYGCIAALLCGIMRMMSGRTIQAITGAIFGPILGGLIYRKTQNIYLVFIGEVIGTGIIGALVSYPLMRLFYGININKWYYYIPLYTPSAIVGAAMGVAVFIILKRSNSISILVNEVR